MKALSLQQPWAWLMVNGYKDIENRNWYSQFRGPVLVHASKRWDKDVFPIIRKVNGIYDVPIDLPLPIGEMPVSLKDFEMGGIVGIFTITNCLIKSARSIEGNPWAFGRYCYTVKDARPLPFTPLCGQLNFFDVSDEILEKLGLVEVAK